MLFRSVVVKAVRDDGEEVDVTNSATITAPATDTAGRKNVFLSCTNGGSTYSASIPVDVINSALLTKNSDQVYVVKADPSVTREGSLVSGVMNFSTIQKAHDFLKAATLDTDKKKIELASNATYKEKLYIEISNLTLEGAYSSRDTYGGSTISYGLDADSKDPLGNSFSTYGSATVTVKELASDFLMEHCTIINDKFTSMSDYNSCTDGNKQAVALLSEGNKAIYSHCLFKGYQDTLYARSNNQAYLSCQIEGMTDYIFGEDSNVYLSSCRIASLDRGSSTNGGYVLAPKGGANATVGFVFDQCSLVKGDSTITDGTVSLARPWAKTAKVRYIHCRMESHISKKAYGDKSDSKNARYESMSNNKPMDADFKEYQNTGEGAISEAVSGMSFLTEMEYQALETFLSSTFDFVTTYLGSNN